MHGCSTEETVFLGKQKKKLVLFTSNYVLFIQDNVIEYSVGEQNKQTMNNARQ